MGTELPPGATPVPNEPPEDDDDEWPGPPLEVEFPELWDEPDERADWPERFGMI